MTQIRDWATAELQYLAAHPEATGAAQRRNDAMRALTFVGATSTGDQSIDGPAAAWDDLVMTVAELLNARAHAVAAAYAPNLSYFDGDVAGSRAYELVQRRHPALMDAVRAAAFANAGTERHTVEQVWPAIDSEFISRAATEVAMVELARWYCSWREVA